MKILIIEDEIITATDIKKTLEKKGYKVLPICKNYEEVARVVEETTPDLILADIVLKSSVKNGIEIASEITAETSTPIIYLTSHTDHETFEKARHTQPVAYLFKPFRKDELVFQIALAFEHYKAKQQTVPDSEQSDTLFFPHNRGHQKIAKRSVLFIKAEGAYVNIFTKDRKLPLMLSMNLGYIAQFFPGSNFYKLGRSYLINLDHVCRFDSDFVYFDDSDNTVPIPQSKKQEFLRMFALAKTPN